MDQEMMTARDSRICEELFSDLVGAVRRGTGRHQKARRYKELSGQLAEFATACDRSLADFLSVALDHYFDRSPVPATIERCDEIIKGSEHPLASFYALSLRASLSLVNE